MRPGFPELGDAPSPIDSAKRVNCFDGSNIDFRRSAAGHAETISGGRSMSWLVDTNVLSELVRPRPNAAVVAWADGIERISVSTITFEEIMFGLAWKPNPRICQWFSQFFAEACDVLPVTAAIAERAGVMRGQLRAAGHTRSQADMLIAATA